MADSRGKLHGTMGCCFGCTLRDEKKDVGRSSCLGCVMSRLGFVMFLILARSEAL